MGEDQIKPPPPKLPFTLKPPVSPTASGPSHNIPSQDPLIVHSKRFFFFLVFWDWEKEREFKRNSDISLIMYPQAPVSFKDL